MPEETKTTTTETPKSSYDGLEPNGSFETGDEITATAETPAAAESNIKSSDDIRRAALEDRSTVPAKPKEKAGEGGTEVETAIEQDQLDETIDDQIKRGVVKVPEQTEENKTEEAQQTQTQNKDIIKGRDYTGIDPNHRWAFEKMPNKAFDHFKKLYTENKKIQNELIEARKPREGDLPKSYIEHPEAYTLSPTYSKITQQLNAASVIEEHWSKQVVNIRRNGKFTPLLQKDGKLMLGEEKEATDEDEAYVMRQVNHAQRQLQKVEVNHDKFVNDFKTNHQQAVQVIKQAEESFFAEFDKPDHPTKKLQEQIKEQIPNAFHDSPLLPLLVKTGASNALLVAENNRLKQEIDKLKGIKKDEAKAPPTGKSFTPGSGGSKSRINSSADIRRVAMEG